MLPHERHPLPPHERGVGPAYEPTHQEIMEKLRVVEDLLRRLEERR